MTRMHLQHGPSVPSQEINPRVCLFSFYFTTWVNSMCTRNAPLPVSWGEAGRYLFRPWAHNWLIRTGLIFNPWSMYLRWYHRLHMLMYAPIFSALLIHPHSQNHLHSWTHSDLKALYYCPLNIHRNSLKCTARKIILKYTILGLKGDGLRLTS